MSETSGRGLSDDLEAEQAQTPVAPEPQDHDGVLEMLDVNDDRVNSAMLDEGMSPPERERHVGRYGLTPDEDSRGESLDERLKEEEPDVFTGSGGAFGAGSPELPADEDVDGELLDDQVGGVRAGRLVEPDLGGGPDVEGSAVASDVGLAGGAASAEEAAMHVVGEGDTDPLEPAPETLRP